MKWSSKKGIQHLVALCVQKGIDHIVISPGSRNAPLTISFNRYPGVETWVIPDERVAGFTALGMAKELGTTVALVCTSGSALLNYAPAMAEALYSHIPLLILSADRPDYWIDQREGQSIRQFHALDAVVKGSFQLPLEPPNARVLQYHDRLINEAINLTTQGNHGPVHINVPLEEPLYDLERMGAVQPQIINEIPSNTILGTVQWNALQQDLSNHRKVMILVGQGVLDPTSVSRLLQAAQDQSVVVLSECTSNLLGEDIVGCIDRNILAIDEERWEAFLPDLLITIGGAVVSKKIKQMLRHKQVQAHWHVDRYDPTIDTYGHLTKNIRASVTDFLMKISFADQDKSFGNRWRDHNKGIRAIHHQVMEEIPYSDLLVFHHVLEVLPEASQLQLSNSSVVRYAQLFDNRTDLKFFANRGVSGIDGSTSTAIGAALMQEDIVTLITGDMSFFYDSNAFWHSQVPSNFRCIVINNGGGGIFRIIHGPDEVNELEEFFEVNQHNDVSKIAAAYDVDFLLADDTISLHDGLKRLYEKRDKACILEVVTPREINSVILKDYFRKIKTTKDEQ